MWCSFDSKQPPSLYGRKPGAVNVNSNATSFGPHLPDFFHPITTLFFLQGWIFQNNLRQGDRQIREEWLKTAISVATSEDECRPPSRRQRKAALYASIHI